MTHYISRAYVRGWAMGDKRMTFDVKARNMMNDSGVYDIDANLKTGARVLADMEE